MNILNLFCFSLAKKGAGADPQKSAPAPAKKPRLRPAPASQHWGMVFSLVDTPSYVTGTLLFVTYLLLLVFLAIRNVLNRYRYILKMANK